MSVHKHGTTGPGCAGTCCLKATDLADAIAEKDRRQGKQIIKNVYHNLSINV